MKNRNLLIYRIVTGLFSAHMIMTVIAYVFMNDIVSETFESLGVPTEVIYPLAVAKVLGLIAIWSNKSRLLKELAYLGFGVDFILASISHGMAGDGGAAWPLVALVIMSISYFYHRKIYVNQA